jgi:hypothetical protein
VTERTQLILYFCIATFLIVVFIAGLLIRRHDRTVRAIDAARKQLHMASENNALEHEKMSKEIKKASGRLQFLTARSIADEIAAEQKAKEAGETAKEPPA